MDKGKIRGSMYEWKVVSYTPYEKSKCIMIHAMKLNFHNWRGKEENLNKAHHKDCTCNESKLLELKMKRRRQCNEITS